MSWHQASYPPPFLTQRSSGETEQGPSPSNSCSVGPEPYALIGLDDAFSSMSPKRKPSPGAKRPPLSATDLPSPYFPRGPTASVTFESGTPSSSAMLATSSLTAPSWGIQPAWSSQRCVLPPLPQLVSHPPKLSLSTDFS